MMHLTSSLSRGGWSNAKRKWLASLRPGARPDRFHVEDKLFYDKYFTEHYLHTLEQANLNRFPQHNSLRNYFSVARNDPMIQGYKKKYEHSPKMMFPYEATRNRYGCQVFFHKRPRDQVILNPYNITL